MFSDGFVLSLKKMSISLESLIRISSSPLWPITEQGWRESAWSIPRVFVPFMHFIQCIKAIDDSFSELLTFIRSMVSPSTTARRTLSNHWWLYSGSQRDLYSIENVRSDQFDNIGGVSIGQHSECKWGFLLSVECKDSSLIQEEIIQYMKNDICPRLGLTSTLVSVLFDLSDTLYFDRLISSACNWSIQKHWLFWITQVNASIHTESVRSLTFVHRIWSSPKYVNHWPDTMEMWILLLFSAKTNANAARIRSKSINWNWRNFW